MGIGHFNPVNGYGYCIGCRRDVTDQQFVKRRFVLVIETIYRFQPNVNFRINQIRISCRNYLKIHPDLWYWQDTTT